MSLASYLDFFNPRFEAYLNEHLLSLPEPRLEDMITHTKKILSGGKRFRPYLLQLMAARSEEEFFDETSLPAAFAVEMIHGFALIHDDIMDKSEMRRSEKSAHLYIEERYAKDFPNAIDLAHIGVSQAILLGDLVFSLAEGALCDQAAHQDSFEARKAMRNCFQQLKWEVMMGQMLDVDFMLRDKVDKVALEQKTFLKTASYSMVRPMQIGAHIAGFGPEVLEFCSEFGRATGLAFQIQDDAFNVSRQGELMGKDIMSDVEGAQHTLVRLFYEQQADEKQQQLLKDALGSELSQADKESLMDAFETIGATQAAFNEADVLYDEAQEILKNAPILDFQRRALSDLLITLRNRHN